jgi:hypothetical protein
LSQETANSAVSGLTEISINFNLSRFVPPQTCPIILDLDGDGVETLALTEGVTFDIDNDGNIDRTGWVGKDDGLLVMDVNQDGMINDAGELFGEEMIKSDGTKASDGFDALRDIDSNNDGLFDSNDDAYDDVKIWQDGNSDGVSQEHELYSLLDVGVDSINLNSHSVSENNEGNWTGLRSTWDGTDGVSHDVDDVWFAYYTEQDNVLDLSDLLDSGEVQMDSLDHYLRFEQQDTDLLVYVDENGGGANETFATEETTQLVKLENVALYSMEHDDVIKVLIDNNQLITE